ncbi:MAG: hypothetical protein ABF633_01700 [Clostridium sp.]|uniref:hypothetical protein n=1 Tax=Clostridium sp. TaxID=1506 RepID=UPI0039EBE861
MIDGIKFDNEDEQNRYLLYKYTVKQLISSGFSQDQAETKAQEMILSHSNNLFGVSSLASQLGEVSIEFFCLYYLQDTFLPKSNNAARILAPVHFHIWEQLEDTFLKDTIDKLELIMPRGCAKTTVCDFAISVWLHCYKKSIYTLVAGKTEQDATEFIAQTRQAFEENKYIIKSFGKLIEPKKYTVNKLELELSNHTKIQAISSTSSMRGKKYSGARPSCIIADDYQSKSDCITEEARDKKYNTWIEDSGYAGDKAVYRDGEKIKQATKFIVLGTILHRDCFMSRLLKNKDYKHIVKRVVDFNVDEYFHLGLWEEFRKLYFNDKSKDSVSEAKEFYYQHESDMQYETIWQDKYDCLDLAIDYYNNPTAFKQEMMNDASKIGDKWFKSNRTQSLEEIKSHNFIKNILVCDPANSISNKADFSAFAIGGLADNDFIYIKKGELLKVGFDDFCNRVIKLLKDFPEITHVSIEKNLYMGADVLKIKELISKDIDLMNRDITFINKMQKKNKDEKISTIISDVNNGRIIFNQDDKDFIEQIMGFCGQEYSEHDDAPDSVAQLTLDIKEIQIIERVTFMDIHKLF